jgi:hypothetical protein
MSSGNGVLVGGIVGSDTDVADGVGTGVAEGVPQAASNRTITRHATNEALTFFMSMLPGSKRSQQTLIRFAAKEEISHHFSLAFHLDHASFLKQILVP